MSGFLDIDIRGALSAAFNAVREIEFREHLRTVWDGVIYGGSLILAAIAAGIVYSFYFFADCWHAGKHIWGDYGYPRGILSPTQSRSEHWIIGWIFGFIILSPFLLISNTLFVFIGSSIESFIDIFKKSSNVLFEAHFRFDGKQSWFSYLFWGLPGILLGSSLFFVMIPFAILYETFRSFYYGFDTAERWIFEELEYHSNDPRTSAFRCAVGFLGYIVAYAIILFATFLKVNAISFWNTLSKITLAVMGDWIPPEELAPAPAAAPDQQAHQAAAPQQQQAAAPQRPISEMVTFIVQVFGIFIGAIVSFFPIVFTFLLENIWYYGRFTFIMGAWAFDDTIPDFNDNRGWKRHLTAFLGYPLAALNISFIAPLGFIYETVRSFYYGLCTLGTWILLGGGFNSAEPRSAIRRIIGGLGYPFALAIILPLGIIRSIALSFFYDAFAPITKAVIGNWDLEWRDEVHQDNRSTLNKIIGRLGLGFALGFICSLPVVLFVGILENINYCVRLAIAMGAYAFGLGFDNPLNDGRHALRHFAGSIGYLVGFSIGMVLFVIASVCDIFQSLYYGATGCRINPPLAPNEGWDPKDSLLGQYGGLLFAMAAAFFLSSYVLPLYLFPWLGLEASSSLALLIHASAWTILCSFSYIGLKNFLEEKYWTRNIKSNLLFAVSLLIALAVSPAIFLVKHFFKPIYRIIQQLFKNTDQQNSVKLKAYTWMLSAFIIGFGLFSAAYWALSYGFVLSLIPWVILPLIAKPLYKWITGTSGRFHFNEDRNASATQVDNTFKALFAALGSAGQLPANGAPLEPSATGQPGFIVDVIIRLRKSLFANQNTLQENVLKHVWHQYKNFKPAGDARYPAFFEGQSYIESIRSFKARFKDKSEEERAEKTAEVDQVDTLLRGHFEHGLGIRVAAAPGGPMIFAKEAEGQRQSSP